MQAAHCAAVRVRELIQISNPGILKEDVGYSPSPEFRGFGESTCFTNQQIIALSVCQRALTPDDVKV